MSCICAMRSTRRVPFFQNRCAVVGCVRSLQVRAAWANHSWTNYMEWIPQPCLCMLVGLNVGFTRAVSHRLMMEVQRPLNYRVLGCYLNWNHYRRENKHYIFLNYLLGQLILKAYFIHHVWVNAVMGQKYLLCVFCNPVNHRLPTDQLFK